MRHTEEPAEWLYGITGTASDNVVAVGAGTILGYDGLGWTRRTDGAMKRLSDVWAFSKNDVIVVGEEGTIMRFYRNRWEILESGTLRDLLGVWGTARDTAFAVGAGRILQFDGVSWSRTIFPSELFYDVWGISGDAVYATSSTGRVYRYDGVNWDSGTFLTSKPMRAIWGIDQDNIYVASHDGLIMRHDGVFWSSMNTDTNNDLYAIWGYPDKRLVFGTHRLFAAGAEGTILTYDYVTRRWTQMTSGTDRDLNGLTHTSNGDLYACGDAGTILFLEYDSWVPMESGTTELLAGISGLTGGMMFAVGGDAVFSGVVLRYGPE